MKIVECFFGATALYPLCSKMACKSVTFRVDEHGYIITPLGSKKWKQTRKFGTQIFTQDSTIWKLQ